MASSWRLAVTEAKHQARMRATEEDPVKAHELAERFPGWHVLSSRDGSSRVATRTGNQEGPDGDRKWAASLIGDSWTDLELQLQVQAQHDAELTYLS
jgi:hypothetical protein